MREIIMIITIIIIIIPNLVLAQNDNSKYDPSQDVFEFLVNGLTPLLIILLFDRSSKDGNRFQIINIIDDCLMVLFVFAFPPYYNYIFYSTQSNLEKIKWFLYSLINIIGLICSLQFYKKKKTAPFWIFTFPFIALFSITLVRNVRNKHFDRPPTNCTQKFEEINCIITLYIIYFIIFIYINIISLYIIMYHCLKKSCQRLINFIRIAYTTSLIIIILLEGYIVAVLLSNSVYLTKGLLGLIALGISRIIEHTRDKKDSVNTVVSKIINAHYFMKEDDDIDSIT
ncbi:hypothetical protein RhiirB3_427594 [Rhizophagus irregularis]|nr:hypothetical protein RhiirB3_427594 [Rhizophagus irregularis]